MNCAALADILTKSVLLDVECRAAEKSAIVFTSTFQHDDGDLVEFLLSNDNGHLVLSDAGETAARIFLSGYNVHDVETDKRRFLRALSIVPDVTFHNDELSVTCDERNLFAALTSLATAISRIESSLQMGSVRQQEYFPDQVAKILAVNRIPFVINQPFKAETAKPIVVQFYVPGKKGSPIGYALSGKRRIPQPSLKARLYDIGRLRREQDQLVLPFLVFPDGAQPTSEQYELLAREKVRYFNVPREEGNFVEFLRQAA